MNLGEALTFETRRGAEQLEQTVRDINRLEAMPATPVRLQLPAATAEAMTASAAGAAAAPPALRDATPSLRREEVSPAQPQPPPEPWSLPPAGEGGEAARAAMRARLDAAPRVELVCPACLASALLACWPRRPWSRRLAHAGPAHSACADECALGLRRACSSGTGASGPVLLRGPGPLLPSSKTCGGILGRAGERSCTLPSPHRRRRGSVIS